MKLWRLTRAGHVALDGKGAQLHGARYAPAGRPVVSLASEAGLAVLVTLRYHLPDLATAPADLVLGWTTIPSVPEPIGDAGHADDAAISAAVAGWLGECRSLACAIRSKVLPEADVIYLNPLHPDAARVPPLVTRPFSFADCLHPPPMRGRFSGDG